MLTQFIDLDGAFVNISHITLFEKLQDGVYRVKLLDTPFFLVENEQSIKALDNLKTYIATYLKA